MRGGQNYEGQNYDDIYSMLYERVVRRRERGGGGRI